MPRNPWYNRTAVFGAELNTFLLFLSEELKFRVIICDAFLQMGKLRAKAQKWILSINTYKQAKLQVS